MDQLGPVEASPRFYSVDVLRGIIMFTMIFVNDIAGGARLPWWLKHFDDYKPGGNGMTFVDVVFPAFLFIVGLSIPLAIENRLRKGDGWLRIYGHVILRTLSLLAIGVLMVEDPSDSKIGWREGLWSVLMFCGVILAFHSVRFVKPALRYTSLAIRIVGGAMLIYLVTKYRNAKGGHIEPSWWGILGLIGWAYFIAATAYILLRKEGQAALVGMAAVLMSVYFADHAGSFRALERLHFFMFHHKIAPLSIIGFGDAWGSQPAISMCGVVIGSMLLPWAEQKTPAAKIRFAAVFTVLLCLGALLLYKTFGINKDNATPSWCLWSAAITTTLWIILYAVIDVAGIRAWSTPLAWAGASALLIYILSELWASAGPMLDFMDRYRWYQWYDDLGDSYPHVIYHGLITAAVLALVGGVLGRVGFKLKL